MSRVITILSFFKDIRTIFFFLVLNLMLVENVVFYFIETRRIYIRKKLYLYDILCMILLFFFRVVEYTNTFKSNWNKHYTRSKLIRVKSNLDIYRVLKNLLLFFFVFCFIFFILVLSMLEINGSLDIKLKLVIMHAQTLPVKPEIRHHISRLCIDSSLIKYLENIW